MADNITFTASISEVGVTIATIIPLKVKKSGSPIKDSR